MPIRPLRNRLRALGLGLLLAGLPALHAAPPPPLPPFETGAISLPLDNTPVTVGPLVTTRNQTAPQATHATLQANATHLTLRFTCQDTQQIARVTGRDHTDLWTDDNVELFLDPHHQHDLDADWIHLLITTAGQILDERGPARGYFNSGMPMGGQVAYTCEGLDLAVQPQPDGWSAQLIIPWAALGITPRPGLILGFNLNRSDPPDGYYGLFPTHGPFLTPDRWGHLILTAAGPADPSADAVLADTHDGITRARTDLKAERNRYVTLPQGPNPPAVIINSVRYGAEADERGPIGGGAGYTGVFTRGDFEPRNLPALIEALAAARTGQVIFLRGDVIIDATEWWYTDKLVLEIPAGVTLAGDRGLNGSPGPLICTDAFEARPLLRTLGPDVTVSGIRLRGPDSQIRQDHHQRSNNPSNESRKLYYQFPTSDGLETRHDRLTVANCEISGWSHGGVYLKGGRGHHVHHNHIHHNRRQGLGYGISLDVAEALIERNLFEHNRHDIAGTGRAGSGYEACHNIVLAHSAVSHHFDMHGGADRKDGTDLAGDWLKIHHNAFYGSGQPIKIRGTPAQEADIHHNWFPYHKPPLTPADLLKSWMAFAVYSHGHTRVQTNAYGTVLVK